MPKQKLKTSKTISKRVKVSGGKKGTITTRKAGQDHFNARESGKVTRNKRGNQKVAKVNMRTIKRAINS